MRHLRLLIIAMAAICVLALAAFAFVTQPPVSGEDVIIIKGGSLTLKCPPAGNANNTNNANNANDDCMPFDSASKTYKHKNSSGKIDQIVIKNGNGETLGTFTKSPHFSDGKPSIEITYK
jgi:hypothetical protein